jgi:hypothetical protein
MVHNNPQSPRPGLCGVCGDPTLDVSQTLQGTEVMQAAISLNYTFAPNS